MATPSGKNVLLMNHKHSVVLFKETAPPGPRHNNAATRCANPRSQQVSHIVSVES